MSEMKKELTGFTVSDETTEQINAVWFALASTVLKYRGTHDLDYGQLLQEFVQEIGQYIEQPLLDVLEKAELKESSKLGCEIQAPIPIYLVTAEEVDSDSGEHKIEALVFEGMDYIIHPQTKELRCRINFKPVMVIGKCTPSEEMLEVINKYKEQFQLPIIDMYVNEKEVGFTAEDVEKLFQSE